MSAGEGQGSISSTETNHPAASTTPQDTTQQQPEQSNESRPFTISPSLLSSPLNQPAALWLAAQQDLAPHLMEEDPLWGMATGNLVFSVAPPVPATAAAAAAAAPPAGAEPEPKPEPRLLLIQRAPHDSMPLCWEIPGGAVDDEDETVLHGAARELREEAGLRAARMVAELGPLTAFRTRSGLRVVRASFLVEVEAEAGGLEGMVKLDPNEHTAYVWVTEAEARAKKIGDLELVYTSQDQEDVIFKAFSAWKDITNLA
ncbi:NUDIX hydrolase domain-like protein [Xylariales sp. PMI_506]|nr:NUDIX hydrolase domain-like protein [Xylariales sp. PMI_506]